MAELNRVASSIRLRNSTANRSFSLRECFFPAAWVALAS